MQFWNGFITYSNLSLNSLGRLLVMSLTLIAPAQELSAGTGTGTETQRLAQLAGRIQDVNGRPLSDVTITDVNSGVTVMSDTLGRFALDGLEPSIHKISYVKSRYIEKMELIPLHTGKNDEPVVYLMQRSDAVTVLADGPFVVEQGPVRISFPATSLVFKEALEKRGEEIGVSGSVQIELTPFDPAKPNVLAAAPAPLYGLLEDGNLTWLTSYMMFRVEMTQDHKELQLRPGTKAVVQMRLGMDSTLKEGDTVPMWTSDPEQNLWVLEEPIATTKFSSDGTRYLEVALPHFSNWNADRSGTSVVVDATMCSSPEPGCSYKFSDTDFVQLKQVNQDGTPASAAYWIQVTHNTEKNFRIMFPQCGVASTFFKVTATFNGKLCTLAVSSSKKAYGGATIPESTTVPASKVCDYLRSGGAHADSPGDIEAAGSSCNGSKANCDGNLCTVSQYITGGSTSAYDYGTCSSIVSPSDGLDKIGMKLEKETSPTSFSLFRLPMTFKVMSCP